MLKTGDVIELDIPGLGVGLCRVVKVVMVEDDRDFAGDPLEHFRVVLEAINVVQLAVCMYPAFREPRFVVAAQVSRDGLVECGGPIASLLSNTERMAEIARRISCLG